MLDEIAPQTAILSVLKAFSRAVNVSTSHLRQRCPAATLASSGPGATEVPTEDPMLVKTPAPLLVPRSPILLLTRPVAFGSIRALSVRGMMLDSCLLWGILPCALVLSYRLAFSS